MPIENLLLFLAMAATVALFMWDMTRDPRIMDAPTTDEMTTVIPDPFAPVTREPKHRDEYRAIDTPYLPMSFFHMNYGGERSKAIAMEKEAHYSTDR